MSTEAAVAAAAVSQIPEGVSLQRYTAVREQLHNTAARPRRHSRAKLIHFVRHAQGHHNVAGESDFEEYKNEKYEDATLSELGEKQCRELNAASTDFICECIEGNRVELVVTSVLRRCLQTSSLCFPELKNKLPWVATELCREQTGQHPCDRRRPISETRANAEFNHIDFGEIISEDDPLYWKWNNGEREPLEACIDRCEQFLDWLFERDESEILVCTHSAILAHLIPLIEQGGGTFESFHNAEMRSYVVTKTEMEKC
jgi:broad specificity phosphatase PhoE